ncbi:MAG: PTS sugar transporter subunit IIA, partial [Clostridiales Family XIII bacterium]|nr:PTS sugar transporter subunit IIA [Clostridiales Family XIII bacterium]
MKITDLMNINSIQIGAVAKDKDDVLNQMVELQDASGALTDKAVYRQAIQARESQGSTGIGEGIAIPHAKSDSITKPALSAMVIPDGVEFDSLDGEPVYLAFMIAAP